MKKTILFVLSLFLLFSVTACTFAEGGVRVGNNMESYAINYLNNYELIDENEQIKAYYDYTISLDGSEAIILTDKRLIYHNEETSDSFMNLDEIVEIQHRNESMIGDIIEVYTDDGDAMMIEIAPLNNGETFLKILQKTTGIE